MNHIYRVIWNASIGTWVATSELAKGKTKSKTVKKIVVTGLFTLATSTAALAQTIDENLTVNGDLTVSGVVNGINVIDLSDQINNSTTGLATKASQTALDATNNNVTNLTSRVGSAENNISTLENSVNTKASQSALDTTNSNVTNLTSRVGSAENNISTLENSVNTKASQSALDATNSNVTNLTSRVGSAENSISTLENSVNTKASQSALDATNNNVTNLTTRIGSAEDDIDTLEKQLFGSDAAGVKYFRVNSTQNDAQAIGTDAVAIGPQAQSNGIASVALGSESKAVGNSSLAIGQKSQALDESSIAIGAESQALGKNSTAIGSAATNRSIAVEYDPPSSSTVASINGIPVTATSSTAGSQSLDDLAITEINGVDVSTNPNLVAQFKAALASGSSIALGDNSFAAGTSTLAIGSSSVAIGDSVVASANNATAIGHTASASGVAATALGNGANASASSSVAVGDNASSATVGSISIGENAGQGTYGAKERSGSTNDRIEHIAIGSNSGRNVIGNQNIALGSGAGSNLSVGDNSSSDQNIAIGVNAGSNHNGDGNISIGQNANTNTNNKDLNLSVALGSNAQSSNQSVVIGADSQATADNAFAGGYKASVTGAAGTAIGANTTAGAGNVALGANSVASDKSSAASYLIGGAIQNGGFNVVSVGGGTGSNIVARRITNVAAGGDDTDAVNVSQLKKLNQDVAKALFGDSVTNVASGVITDGANNTYNSFLDAIQNLTAANGTPASSDAVKYTVGSSAARVVLEGTDGTTISNLKTDATDDSSAANVAYVNEAVKDATVKYVSINSIESENENSQEAHGLDSLAIGSGVETNSSATKSVAIGFSGVTAENSNTVAMGSNGTSAKGASSIAMGDNAIANAINNISMGTGAVSAGIDSIAIGHNVQVDKTGGGSDYAVVMGSSAEVQNADNAVSIGHTAVVQADNGVAVGNTAVATGHEAVAIGNATRASQEAVAIGDGSQAFGTETIAIGKGNTIGRQTITEGQTQASQSGALGNGNDIKASNSFVIGNSNEIGSASTDTFVLGSNIKTTTSDSVFLGNEAAYVSSNASTKAKDIYNEQNVGNINYKYAGGTATGVVSVGSATEKRRIQNVAAGYVSAESTDAINGSQLYSTNVALNNLQQSTANYLGGGATVDSSGSINQPSYEVTSNPASSSATTTVHTVGAAIDALDNAVKQPLTFTGDSGSVARQLGSTLNIKGGATNSATLTDGNIGVTASGDTLTVKLAKDINLGATGSVTTGNTVVNNNGLVINNADTTKIVSVTAAGINAGGQQVKNVAAGSNATDAVNVEQLTKAKAAATTKVDAGDNINVQSKVNADGSTSYTVATNKEVNFDKVTVGGVVIDKTTNKISGLADGAVNSSSNEAINGSQLYQTNQNVTAAQNAADTAQATADKGLNFAVNGVTPADNVKLGDTVNFADGSNITATYDATTNTYKYNLNDNITLSNTGSVTVGVSKVDNSGVQAGAIRLDAVSGKITGVTAGEAGTDAVNVSQLQAVNEVANKGWKLTT
ncbi:ESPR-type extended signal peptide-containing protein, partial [Acinetobacter qingfengensis]